MRRTHLFVMLFAGAAFVTSCDDKQETVDGWKPIYSSDENTDVVDIKASEPLENPGRIYTYQNLLLVNDQSKGIHIYDNTVNTNPTEVSFIGIPGNMDFSVREGKIYADNITDMVIVDISNPATPVYVNRVTNVFPVQQFPDEFGAFECVDASKGTVIGWEKAKLDNPQCFR